MNDPTPPRSSPFDDELFLTPPPQPDAIEANAEPLQLRPGDSWTSRAAFQAHVRAIALEESWTCAYTYTTASRSIIRCRSGESCTFRAYAALDDVQSLWVLRTLDSSHNCLGSAPKTQRRELSRLEVLAEELPKILQVTHETSTKDIINVIQQRFGYSIAMQQAQRVKRLLLSSARSTIEEDYMRIPSFLQELERHNEGVYTRLQTDEQGRFKRAFIGPPTSDNTLTYSLPFVSLDGCHVRTGWNHIILLATGRDGNNESTLLAWAVVESESEDSWTWFLHAFKACCPIAFDDEYPVTVISDRDKGLQNAIDIVFPASNFKAYCCQHIEANIRNNTGNAPARLFKELARASNEAQYQRVITEMKKEPGGQRAITYIEGINPRLWCTKDFPGPRFGHITSNISEAINSAILPIREMSVLFILNSLWDRTINERFQRYENVKKSQEEAVARNSHWQSYDGLTKYGQVLFRDTVVAARSHSTLINSANPTLLTAKVVTRAGKVYIVDLPQKSCTCLKFQDLQFPCSHAICAIQAVNRSIFDFIPMMYYLQYAELAYAEPAGFWTDEDGENHDTKPPLRPVNTDSLDISTSCIAPFIGRLAKGKAQRKRLQQGQSRRTSYLPQQCTRCRQRGHNRKTCTAVAPTA